MSAKVKVCLIGCGRAGMIHARSYAGSVKNAELIALCDPMDENLTAVQQELKDIRIRWYAGSEVKSIHALGHNFRSPEMAEKYPEYYDTCTVMLEFENGILGVITGPSM